MFQKIIIPQAVYTELSDTAAPLPVQTQYCSVKPPSLEIWGSHTCKSPPGWGI